MDELYRDIYQDIYEAATTPEIPGRLADRWQERPLYVDGEFVRQAIQRAEADHPYRRFLRSDAKALLAVNFAFLVVTPLSIGGRVSTRDIEEEVEGDIRMLVAEADGDRENRDEISGHAIIDSLSRNWSKLRVSRFRLWQQEIE